MLRFVSSSNCTLVTLMTMLSLLMRCHLSYCHLSQTEPLTHVMNSLSCSIVHAYKDCATLFLTATALPPSLYSHGQIAAVNCQSRCALYSPSLQTTWLRMLPTNLYKIRGTFLPIWELIWLQQEALLCCNQPHCKIVCRTTNVTANETSCSQCETRTQLLGAWLSDGPGPAACMPSAAPTLRPKAFSS